MWNEPVTAGDTHWRLSSPAQDALETTSMEIHQGKSPYLAMATDKVIALKSHRAISTIDFMRPDKPNKGIAHCELIPRQMHNH